MKAIEFRRALPTDVVGLAACINSAYAKYKDRIIDMPPVSDGCADDIANHAVWIAVSDDTIVGALVLIPQDSIMKLANIAVHSKHTGKGIGGKLMALAERLATEKGHSELHLNTHVAMPENVELYSHLGWEEVSRSGNTVSMIKKL